MNGNILRHRQAAGLLGLAAAVLLVGTASLAQAQGNANWSWNVTTGDFTVSSNWNTNNSSYSYVLGSVIDNGGTATVAAGGTAAATDQSGNGILYIGGYSTPGVNGGTLDTTAGGNGYSKMSGGTVNIAQQILGTSFLADGVTTTSGIFTQTGGVNCPFTPGPTYPDAGTYPYNTLEVGYGNGGYGEYDMSGGSLGVNCIYVGASAANPTVSYGTGVFTQTGGSIGRLAAGSASVQPLGLMVGGNWTGQYFGNKAAALTTGVGTYNMSGQNTLFVGGVEVVGANGTGTFTQNGGSNEIVGGGNSIGYINGTSYRNDYGALILGQYGTLYANNRYVGDGVGTYNLQSGLVDGGGAAAVGQDVGGYEVVGFGGTGIFNQSGGTNNATSDLYVGGVVANLFATSTWARGGSGTYNLTGGLVDCPVIPQGQGGVGGNEYLGQGGTGQFNQSGGTNMTPAIYFGGSGSIYNPGLKTGHKGYATYNLSGGLLQAQ